jgi:cytoskeletal protein RodZ
MRKIVPEDRVRQGPKGRPVLLVLVGSLLLIGLYLVSLLVWSGAESPTHPSQAASQQTITRPESSNTAHTPPANPAYPAPASPSATGSTTPSQPGR